MSVQTGWICVSRMPTVLTMRVATRAHVLMDLSERDFTTVKIVSCIPYNYSLLCSDSLFYITVCGTMAYMLVK